MMGRGVRSMAMALLVGLALGACSSAEVAMTDEERAAVAEEAEGVIGSIFDAMNAADPDAVLSYYSTEPFVRVSCTQVQDQSMFMAATKAYYGSRDSLDFRYRVEGSRVMGPDAAIVTAAGGLPDVDGLFWTWVLEREGGVLRIVHEHESWPDCPAPRESTFHSTGEMGEGMDEAPGG